MSTLAILAAVLLGFGLVAGRAERWAITPPMTFVAAGALLGPSGLGGFEVELDEQALLVLAEVALVLVLFTDAARLDLRALRGSAQLPARTLGLGMPLVIVAGTAAGALLLADRLSFWEAAVLAAVLAPTDAALGEAVVSARDVPRRVRQALNVEAGLNDGLSVPFLLLFVAFAGVEEQLRSPGYWTAFAAEQIGFGLAMGAAVGTVGGWLVQEAERRGLTTGSFERLAVLALAVCAWALAEAAGGNGFIAAFVGGLAAGRLVSRCAERVVDFTEREGQLLNLSVFFLFGALAPGLLGGLDWRLAAYALVSLTVVRMIPVALALAGTELRARTVAFIGWFGPRGLASIILAFVVVEQETEIAGLETILAAMTLTVLASVALHGLTARPLAAAYARWAGAMDPDAAEREPGPELATRTAMPSELS